MDKSAIFALVIAGVCLIIGEIFVPGGFVGIIGIVLLLIGIIAGFFVSPTLGFGLLIGALIFGIVLFWLWMKFFPGSPMGRRIILQGNAKEWQGYDRKQSELVGKEGVARSPLHPSGTATIEGKRVDVVTRGELIDSGARVRVLEVAGNRVVVEETE